MPIVAALWGQTDDSAPDAAPLTEIGASSVAVTLAEACTRIMSLNQDASAQKAKLMASQFSASSFRDVFVLSLLRGTWQERRTNSRKKRRRE